MRTPPNVPTTRASFGSIERKPVNAMKIREVTDLPGHHREVENDGRTLSFKRGGERCRFELRPETSTSKRFLIAALQALSRRRRIPRPPVGSVAGLSRRTARRNHL